MLIYYHSRQYRYSSLNKGCCVCDSGNIVTDLFINTSAIKVIGYLCSKHYTYFDRMANDKIAFIYHLPDYIPEKQYLKYIKKGILKEERKLFNRLEKHTS